MWTIVIEALAPLDPISCIKMYENNTRSRLFCWIAIRPIVDDVDSLLDVDGLIINLWQEIQQKTCGFTAIDQLRSTLFSPLDDTILAALRKLYVLSCWNGTINKPITIIQWNPCGLDLLAILSTKRKRNQGRYEWTFWVCCILPHSYQVNKTLFLHFCLFQQTLQLLYYAHPNRFCVVQENVKPEVLKVQTELWRSVHQDRGLIKSNTNCATNRSLLNTTFRPYIHYQPIIIFHLRSYLIQSVVVPCMFVFNLFWVGLSGFLAIES